MAHVTAFESITLDGVMQGLGRPDEDTRDGFAHGGWGDGFADEVSMGFAAEGMAEEGAMLLGRRTYEDLLGYWTATPEPNPFTEHLLATTKHVVTRDPGADAAYPGTTLHLGEAVETVAALSAAHPDLELTIIGSGALVRSLHAVGLVDGYTLMIHPIVLGSGQRLFAPGDRTDLRLRRSVTTTTGVVIADYAVEVRR